MWHYRKSHPDFSEVRRCFSILSSTTFPLDAGKKKKKSQISLTQWSHQIWRIINVSGRRERAKIPWNQQQKLSHRAGNTPTWVIHLCWPSWCSECQLTLSPVNPAALEQHGMCISMYKHTASKTSQLIWAINKMARSLGIDSPTRCEMAHQIAASNTLFSCSIITIQKTFQYILCEKKSQSQDCRLFSRVLKSIVLCFFNT